MRLNVLLLLIAIAGCSNKTPEGGTTPTPTDAAPVAIENNPSIEKQSPDEALSKFSEAAFVLKSGTVRDKLSAWQRIIRSEKDWNETTPNQFDMEYDPCMFRLSFNIDEGKGFLAAVPIEPYDLPELMVSELMNQWRLWIRFVPRDDVEIGAGTVEGLRLLMIAKASTLATDEADKEYLAQTKNQTLANAVAYRLLREAGKSQTIRIKTKIVDDGETFAYQAVAIFTKEKSLAMLVFIGQ